MKAKRIRIGIKTVPEALEDFVKTGEVIQRGRNVRTEKGVYFESIEGFRRALTPKRLELLRLIKEKHPESLQELARFAHRDMKSIVTDINILESLDLVDLKRKSTGRKQSTPTVNYDQIDLQIAV
jgi:predicted transcriptional regulator